MSEDGELWRDWRDGLRKLRVTHGVPCPKCVELQPKRHPTIMLPGQMCRVDGHVDPRPRLTDDEFERVTGWRRTR